MPRVRVAAAAREDLERLNTRARVRRRLRALREFPLLGRQLEGRHEGTRYLIGPWPWLLVVYELVANRDEVVVPGMFDARG